MGIEKFPTTSSIHYQQQQQQQEQRSHRAAMKDVKLKSQLADLVNYRLRVLVQDGRVYVGELLAFDKHMNMVLADCVEERVPRTQVAKLQGAAPAAEVRVERRVLGLTILRGETVLSTVVEDTPTMTKAQRLHETKKQKKQLAKQRRARKGKVEKPAVTVKAHNDNRGAAAAAAAGPQAQRFQPPPGFKRR